MPGLRQSRWRATVRAEAACGSSVPSTRTPAPWSTFVTFCPAGIRRSGSSLAQRLERSAAGSPLSFSGAASGFLDVNLVRGKSDRGRRLERHAESEPHRRRLDRFEMNVVNRCPLVRQLRGVEIIDLVGARIVEQIEDVEPQLRLLGEFVADAQIYERRRS